MKSERLIVEGFFDPIMQRIPFEGVRQRFQEAIHNKMESFTSSRSFFDIIVPFVPSPLGCAEERVVKKFVFTNLIYDGCDRI